MNTHLRFSGFQRGSYIIGGWGGFLDEESTTWEDWRFGKGYEIDPTPTEKEVQSLISPSIEYAIARFLCIDTKDIYKSYPIQLSDGFIKNNLNPRESVGRSDGFHVLIIKR